MRNLNLSPVRILLCALAIALPALPPLAGTALAFDCSGAPDGTGCDDGDLCTYNDNCQGGVCVGGSSITCTPLDQCHDAGTCDPGTGACSNPDKADGSACNDGNACTQTDTCQAGTCSGGLPVVCTAQDQCHDAGTCNPFTGVCSNPISADGTACDDFDLCTQVDTCQSGTCTGGDPVVCTALDQCHNVGVCEAANGLCSNPKRANFTPCDDGDACTQTDYCEAGLCRGIDEVECNAAGPCYAPGGCNPSTGLCSNPPLPPGFPCNDGNACTTGDSCNSGVCVSGPAVTCGATDSCHSAGTCDAMTGVCTNPVLDDFSPCDDGDACTGPDVCKMGACVADPLVCPDVSPCADEHCEAGVGCVATPAPATDCRGSLSSKLSFSDGDDSAKDKLKWTWSKGAQTTAAELGNPVTGEGYDLCVFAVSDTDTTLVVDSALAGGAGWAAISDKGYKFSDKDAVSGASKATLKSGAQGKSKIGVSGKGSNLDDGVMPLDPTASLLVQLSNGDSGLCFESSFPASGIVVKGSKFSATAGPALSILCSNSVKDGDETDVDCGGSCDVCADGSDCAIGADCASGACNSGVCALTCAAGTADCNGMSTDGCEANTNTDDDNCGACLAPCDSSETCTAGQCVSTDTCSNGFKDGNETDKDCGGGTCSPCTAYQYCSVGSDCQSGSCPIGKCDP